MLLKKIEHEIHYKKFTQIDNEFKNKSFNQIIDNYNNIRKIENVFFDLLINSKIPYIILYIPNNITKLTLNQEKIYNLEILIKQLKEKDDIREKEIKQLKEKDDKREKEMKKLNDDINDLRILLNKLNKNSAVPNDINEVKK